jgi:hypothetical protein
MILILPIVRRPFVMSVMLDLFLVLSAVCAVAAALLWLLSARVEIPGVRDNLDEMINDMNKATAALRRQSHLSRYGAYAAAGAAGFQAAAMILTLLSSP